MQASERSFAYDQSQLQEWSITQCYFAVMGGLRIQTGESIADSPRLCLTAEGARLMSFLGQLPPVPEDEIRDQSKADGLAKFLVVLQAGWFILQTLARVQQKLPVTLLEINTMGHVLCAFSLYALWWSKPLDIKKSTLIRHERWMDSYISLMYMCSPICWNDNDFISEIRCMSYLPPDQRDSQEAVASPRTPVAGRVAENPKSEKSEVLKKPHKTHFSIGSIGARDPKKFIGPLENFEMGVDGKALDHDVGYVIRGQSFKVAPEHTVFFEIEKPSHGLQHSKVYCRRALKDCDKHDPLSEYAIERWRQANEIIDDLWTECEKRPEYKSFFFTSSSIGTWVGELVYITDHVPNFPGLGYLGSVNVHRDSLKSVAAFAGAAYGGLHLSAWNDYFPTQVERWLWISCALATGATGTVLALFFLASQKIRAFENLEHFFRNNPTVKWASASIISPLFITARVFVVVEAFISLRWAPEDIYRTPEWSNYLPHL